MFFIGIFGIQNKEKEIKLIDNIQCKNCSKNTTGRLIKTYNYFHFFFIPLFKWNEKYHLICNGCAYVYEISKEKGKSIERGEEAEITYWDLKPDESMSYNNFLGNNICSSCGKELKPGYEYCPYCGTKVKN